MAAAALLAGCAQTRQFMGTANQDDNNVLTGGPVSGTKIVDLPQAVRQTLMDQMPDAEITDIDRITRNGQSVYKVSFIDSDRHPDVRIDESGRLLNESSTEVEEQADNTEMEPINTPQL